MCISYLIDLHVGVHKSETGLWNKYADENYDDELSYSVLSELLNIHLSSSKILLWDSDLRSDMNKFWNGWLINDELERIWKEVVMDQLA
jgi:hypothetical protein